MCIAGDHGLIHLCRQIFSSLGCSFSAGQQQQKLIAAIADQHIALPDAAAHHPDDIRLKVFQAALLAVGDQASLTAQCFARWDLWLQA